MGAMKAIVARLGFDLTAGTKYAPGKGEGEQVFINHVPQVNKEKGEFVIIRRADGDKGRFGVQVTPSAPIEKGFKVLDDLSKIVDWAPELGVEIFKRRGFYGVVNEELDSRLHQPFEGAFPYGHRIEIRFGHNREKSGTVMVVSNEPFEAGTLVEAKKAQGSVLIVKRADFEEKATEYDGFVEFVEALLSSATKRYSGTLTPKQPVIGLWVGEDIDTVGNRGQYCLRDVVDIKVRGESTGETAVVWFNRTDGVLEPITAGTYVRVTIQGKNTFGIEPCEERSSLQLHSENVPELLRAHLEAAKYKTKGNMTIRRVSTRV